MYNKKITSKFDKNEVEIGVVTRTTTTQVGQEVYTKLHETRYWREEKGRYYPWGQKTQIHLYVDNNIISVLDDRYADAGHLLALLYNMDNNNMIILRDGHTKHAYPAATREDVYKLAGYSNKTAGLAFFRLLLDKDVIKIITVNDNKGSKNYNRYYINPIFTMRDRGITLDLYKLFRESIDPYLTDFARQDLQKLIYREITGDHEENIEIDNTNGGYTAVSNTDKQAVFNEYILHDEAPKTYQKIGKGMIAHPMTDDNDTYFIVNQTLGYKTTKPADIDIKGFTAWFVDIDAGKGEDGKYFSLDEVSTRKVKMMHVINALPTPTAIVDTRNGYHVYYACYGDITTQAWNTLEDKLFNIAQIADPAATDVSRLLRLPNSKWIKTNTGLAPYDVTIKQANRQAYDLDSFNKQLDEVQTSVQATAEDYLSTYPMAKVSKAKTAAGVKGNEEQSARVQAIINLSTETFETALVTFTDNINEYLHQINLAEFLQIENPSSFVCVLHDDHSPSATIYANETGYRYYCGSSACVGDGEGKGRDIIDVVMILADCKYQQAVNYLSTVYSIKQQATA